MKQNFIELITVPFQAGESKLFAISGQYFELIDATNPIDVLLSDVNGAQRGVMRSAEASFNLKDTDFATVQLYSATAQTIRFAYGTGEAGTRRAAGAVSIVGDVGLNPATLAALESTDLNTATINSLTRPLLAGVSSNNAVTMAANVPATMLLPSANVNGLILHSAHAVDYNPTQFVLSLIAKNSAPTTVIDGTVLAIGQNNVTSGTCTAFLELNRDILVPAGLGLYYIMSQAGLAGMARTLRYTLL